MTFLIETAVLLIVWTVYKIQTSSGLIAYKLNDPETYFGGFDCILSGTVKVRVV